MPHSNEQIPRQENQSTFLSVKYFLVSVRGFPVFVKGFTMSGKLYISRLQTHLKKKNPSPNGKGSLYFSILLLTFKNPCRIPNE